ncbi:21797_t:CDS:2 [Cetraspora pellucida]|uniref:21797_t:CDS:1 n=1 Tax=Cetraspora pellucida TaxID=1433469 RepID=A0A9N9EWZ7_9GLOM|nr:21797_t:CDS:2 [Cetraspora pellucida]
MSNEKQNKNHEKHEKKQKRGNENKRKNILNACNGCRIKKIRCSGGARCDCCTRNNLVCFYPTPKKRGPKHRQENTPHNGINHVPNNNPINLLSERVSNVEDMLSKVSGESIDDKEASMASFDKLLQSVTAFVNEPPTLFSPDVLSSATNIPPLYQRNNMNLDSHSNFSFGEQPYMLHDTLPTFIENNMLIPETYYPLTTEEHIFTGAPSSDEYPI